MTRWILAAEADKIQHLVFRSAHLREVVGGSQLLTRFCREGARQLLAHQRGCTVAAVEPDVLVADGGSFTILFDGKDEARRFGEELKQLYREVIGSTLTVADPVEWPDAPANFKPANERSRQILAQAKRAGRGADAVTQLPYAAFCASCGVGLAHTHEPLYKEATANYLCPACRRKADESQRLRLHSRFVRAVVGAAVHEFDLPRDADRAAEGWDPRQYVAYLVADGNGMGGIFGECVTSGDLKRLSSELTDRVMIESLAAPTQLLMARAPGFRQREIPMLPLILGGDDVFVRMPAPYALDFARHFCWKYVELMEGLLSELKISAQPTISAAVVVCKSKYPHTLVHQYGEELLTKAKRLTKAVALEKRMACSIVHFDLVLGNRIAGASGDASGDYRATLRPYWTPRVDAVSKKPEPLPDQVGLPLDRLIAQRYALRSLPARRLAQLQTIFDPAQIPVRHEDTGIWTARLGQLAGRIARSRAQAEALDRVLAALGGTVQGSWYEVSRPGARPFSGHGLPDLLKMWDFCLDLTQDRAVYAEREE